MVCGSVSKRVSRMIESIRRCSMALRVLTLCIWHFRMWAKRMFSFVLKGQKNVRGGLNERE